MSCHGGLLGIGHIVEGFGVLGFSSFEVGLLLVFELELSFSIGLSFDDSTISKLQGSIGLVKGLGSSINRFGFSSISSSLSRDSSVNSSFLFLVRINTSLSFLSNMFFSFSSVLQLVSMFGAGLFSFVLHLLLVLVLSIPDVRGIDKGLCGKFLGLSFIKVNSNESLTFSSHFVSRISVVGRVLLELSPALLAGKR
jgi:hypothetical protein